MPSTARAGSYGSNSATLPAKPPAYDYFNEPTVYAQIDHLKSLPNCGAMQSTSPMMNCSSASATTIAPSMVAHHQINNFMSNTVPAVSSATSPHYDASDGASVGRGNGTLSNSNTMTLSPTSSQTSYQNHNNQQQSQSQPHLANASKQFSREIVTIRTPLLYSQQESCV